MDASNPVKSREMQNHHTDSTYWEDFVPRDDDIFIVTCYKSGTTWMQQILAQLIFKGGEYPRPLNELSPRVDMRFLDREKLFKDIESFTHRRFLKTHLPLDCLRFFPQCKYIYIGRDGRDVLWSCYDHHCNMNEDYMKMVNNPKGLVGPPLQAPPPTVKEAWDAFLGPNFYFWSFFEHVGSWWRGARHLDNVHFVHFHDLKTDLKGEMEKIAAFIGVEREDDTIFANQVEACTFDAMKQNADNIVPLKGALFKGGAQSFINKGQGGRWRDILTEEDHADYLRKCAESIPADGIEWINHGTVVSTIQPVSADQPDA